jgi:hypothetical protein
LAHLATSQFVAFTKPEAKTIVASKENSGPRGRPRPAGGRPRMYAEFYASLLAMSEKRGQYHSTRLSSNLRINRAALCLARSGSAR